MFSFSNFAPKYDYKSILGLFDFDICDRFNDKCFIYQFLCKFEYKLNSMLFNGEYDF